LDRRRKTTGCLFFPEETFAIKQGYAARWKIEQMMKEVREGQPGNALVAQHLAHLMLVQALRVHLDTSAGDRVGWFFSLSDKQLGAARKPTYDKTVQPA
jgi:hypothetical protein